MKNKKDDFLNYIENKEADVFLEGLDLSKQFNDIKNGINDFFNRQCENGFSYYVLLINQLFKKNTKYIEKNTGVELLIYIRTDFIGGSDTVKEHCLVIEEHVDFFNKKEILST